MYSNIRNKVLSLASQVTSSGGGQPEVTKIYEGTKMFWRQDVTVLVVIYEHKSASSSCLEVISSYTIGEKGEAPRLYYSFKKIFSKLKPSELQIGRHTISENSARAKELVAKFIFSRIAM